ncbi:hypothetical protein A6R68_05377, partial [Neotoma lepida]
KKSDEENLFEIITADEVHYYLQAATPKERTEWIKAIQVASRTGKFMKLTKLKKDQKEVSKVGGMGAQDCRAERCEGGADRRTEQPTAIEHAGPGPGKYREASPT